MRNLVIYLTSPSYSYKLPDNMYGDDWTKFKRDYQYLIERFVSTALKAGKKTVTIDIDKLPALSDDLKELKSFMDITPGTKYSIQAWNSRREEAKFFYTCPCISELDASGYVKKLAR